VTAVVPEGLEPLAVWDARDEAFWDGHDALLRACGAIAWAKDRIPARNDACRIEFYLLDAPFAVVTHFARDADGFKYAQDGQAVTEPPVVVPLDELPPAHLLGAP
jgi:hypothetical protein